MMDKRCCRLSKGVEINLDRAMRYVFGDYLLDTQRYELSYRNQPIKLRPKVFHVLSYLIAHRDRVVSKDELLEQVWPNQFIGDGSLNARLSHKNFTRLSNASNLLGQSAKSSSAS
jgi:DNA-binding response OmpR family regulator